MTPKEKAEELVELYQRHGAVTMERYVAKQCTLIAVNEVLNNILVRDARPDERTEFWQQVKNEIEKL